MHGVDSRAYTFSFQDILNSRIVREKRKKKKRGVPTVLRLTPVPHTLRHGRAEHPFTIDEAVQFVENRERAVLGGGKASDLVYPQRINGF